MTATLHMICGKIAAGKSTLAAKLSDAPDTVLLVEDQWLAALFGDQMKTPKDFMHFSAKLRTALSPHIVGLLNAGLSVVLDFQANTIAARTWMRDLIDQSGAAHQLHVLAPPDEVLLNRLHARNASGDHPFQVTDEQFYQVSKHFVPPSKDEGFNLVTYDT